MKDKKMISEYDIVKEILTENPEFLEKYLKEKIAEKEVQNLIKKVHQGLKDEDVKSSEECVEILKVDTDTANDNIVVKFFEKVKLFLASQYGLEKESLQITINDVEEDGQNEQKGKFVFRFEINKKSFVYLEIRPSKGSKLSPNQQTRIIGSLKWIQIILHYAVGCNQHVKMDKSKDFLLNIAQ